MKINDAFIDSFLKKNLYQEKRTEAKAYLNALDLPASTEKVDRDELEDRMRSFVQSRVRGKDSVIAVYKKFVEYLKENGVEIGDTDKFFPPVPVDSSFERLMWIAKELQQEDARIENLPNRLWVSERTVEGDLARLCGNDDPISICGRKFKITESTRENGQIKFASTAHPLFLTENLTQVLVLLEGLHHMAENPLYTRYAETTAADVWAQLSDYAKDRVKRVLGDYLSAETDWYQSLEAGEHFQSERQCSVQETSFSTASRTERRSSWSTARTAAS
ncbi:MAG: hypothetical protein IKN53_02935 [Oscillibacter sp.]|nr:hypothetical protein [Oscillibacter sp.]